MDLTLALQCCAALQLLVAVLNSQLVRIMGWRGDLAKLSPLVRQVFHIHSFFLSLTLVLFGVLTWRFTGRMSAGEDELARWLAAGIGLFWAVRWVMQFAFYDSAHWRGDTGRTVIHVCLIAVYGAVAGVYLVAAAL